MDVQAIDNISATSGPAAKAPGELAAFPTASPAPAAPSAPGDATQKPAHTEQTLHHALSQLVGGGSNVSVQYKVVSPNEIVTVFTNADTGAVITQFPSEAMVLIAQFFNKLAGAVVDRTA
ncbi:MAG TPA: flagellar protein FlaG [Candidatus Elarobacter sp.]|jgi:hypothetical protein|nr:flagellar protein FlaG [Candidatus Elarobacter sp.]